MSRQQSFSFSAVHDHVTQPFSSIEELWFWFIQANEARNDGARVTAGSGLIPRPCEPVDILAVLDRLYRDRRLVRDHLLVLRHYGRRMMRPDPERVKERRAAALWDEAIERMIPAFERKGILMPQSGNWMEAAE